MSAKSSSILMSLMVVALASLAMSQPNFELDDFISGPICETCKVFAGKAKMDMPQIKPQVELLCRLSGNDNDIKTCVKLIDTALLNVTNEIPEKTCQTLGFCNKQAAW